MWKNKKKTFRKRNVFFCGVSPGLERDCIAGAFADACAAFDAFIADNGETVFHGDCIDGAGSDASFAAAAN